MLKAERKLQAILKKSQAAGISAEELLSLQILQKIHNGNSDLWKYKKCGLRVLVGIVFVYFLVTLSNNFNYQCLIEMPIDTSKVFRKSENCDICNGVTEVKRLKNLSQSTFEELYAHTGVPIVVTDGAVKWPALQTFNFEFFKQIYTHDDDDPSDTTDECQFFPYKTEFHSLKEVFNMSEARARLEPGTAPWYIGWSNCNDRAGQMLRQYYNQPYFLPENSENIALSWIFMGGPGNGAHMHVDNVVHPSWQAQLSGKKLWRLMPPPECLYHCTEISVTVHPGEIIVVDTNKWYHQTTILARGVSITIGSEFD